MLGVEKAEVGVYAWSQPVRGQEKVPSAEGVGEGWGVSVRAGVD